MVTTHAGPLKALQITTDRWKLVPAKALHVESTHFDALPTGPAVLDSVLVLRDVPFEWSVPEVEPVETIHSASARR